MHEMPGYSFRDIQSGFQPFKSHLPYQTPKTLRYRYETMLLMPLFQACENHVKPVAGQKSP